MQFLAALWLPILVSAAAVFVVSALAWTVLPTHKKEFAPLTDGDAVMALLDPDPPGRYVVPWMGEDGGLSRTEAGRAKLAKGPIAYITIQRRGLPNMGVMMAQSFASQVVISAFVAYLAWHTIAPGAAYLHVFRVTGTAAFMACALGVISESIWFARPWKSLALHWFDALLYALVTGGVFGWLWPR